MRGKAVSNSRLKHPDRITPAYAGKRKRRERPRWVASDHPRACGEKLDVRVAVKVLWGSPPHVRGKGCVLAGRVGAQGITPAHAGKRVFFSRASFQFRDHPRACGEKQKSKAIWKKRKGSPPRMRGKGRRAIRALRVRGITPAHAGKSRQASGAASPRRGSPPRMRGKVPLKGLLHITSGITPAHAGKSEHYSDDPDRLKDHPRACGEKIWPESRPRRCTGSPPRMRGKAVCKALSSASIRITPAHAGKRD